VSDVRRLLAAIEQGLPAAARPVFLRGDGAKEIGLGHLTRSRLFGNHLAHHHGFHPVLLVRDDPAARAFLERTDPDAVLLPPAITVEEERQLLERLAGRHADAIVVFDVLEPERLAATLRALARTRVLTVVVCDGPERLSLSADVVVDGSPAQLEHDYSAEVPVYLVGPRNFLMNPPRRTSFPPAPRPQPACLAVTLGGTDQHDLLFRALDAIEDVRPELPVRVAVSRSSGQLARLERARRDRCEVLVDLDGLEELWAGADLALTAGGNTLFERIAAGLPGATLCQMGQQTSHAEAFCRLGVNFDLGCGPQLSDRALRDRLSRFLQDRELHFAQSRRAATVVDGLGLERVGRIVSERHQEKSQWTTKD
jgi:spore coat polysaccharide biosynthesis predicted glycosyltransferase SpsG